MKKMEWKKSSPELMEKFDRVLPRDARVERRKMFGYPCAFTNGNMFAGLHQENMILRLAEKDRAALIRTGKTSLFEPFPGRTMKEYVVVPPAMLAAGSALEPWMKKSFDYALSLKPKAKKAARSISKAGGGKPRLKR
jgi:TfoX/Sxy family transcriptional regulator of competence genes